VQASPIFQRPARRTLLSARAVAYSDPAGGGGSGIHFAKVLQRLGIADQVNAKAKLGSGILPGDLQLMTSFSAALLSSSKDQKGANAAPNETFGTEEIVRFAFLANPDSRTTAARNSVPTIRV
jgi:hypothetical protein